MYDLLSASPVEVERAGLETRTLGFLFCPIPWATRVNLGEPFSSSPPHVVIYPTETKVPASPAFQALVTAERGSEELMPTQSKL